jgi:tRNA(Ile)-lysidine synthetase-like protein
MAEFFNDWINKPSYWFSKNVKDDLYLTNKYSFLLEYEIIYENPIINIIIYDQLPRHIYRNEYANHIIEYYLQKALTFVNKYKDNDDFINNLNNNDWMFFMLPLRHTNIKENILFVIEKAWKLKEIPKKFLIATYEKANFKEELIQEKYESCNYDRSILDFKPPTNFIKHPNYNIGNFEIIGNLDKNNTIIVSLSGGVDSMICLLNIVDLYYNSYNIIAIHINYNNRTETEEEVKFLKNVCYYFNVKLYVRTINEINRHDCMKNDMRDIYEKYTKKIRFNSYKSFSDKKPIVVLGHNKDDAFENIMTNITNQNKYENLTGMEMYSEIDNIIFLRPLLHVSKNDIYKFAKEHNVSYLKNSTPDWSQRGKIRNLIVPALDNWDKRTIKGFYNLAEIIKEYDLNLKNSIQNFKPEIITDVNNINLSILYWRSGIFKLFNKYTSNKSLKSLIIRLELFIKNYDKIDTNKYFKIMISNEITLEICKVKNNKVIIMLFDK